MTARNTEPHLVDDLLAAAVSSGDVPGVAAVIADDVDIVYEAAHGLRDVSADDKLSTETMFRIASMTKLVTAVAALQLVEQGRVELDAPVGNYVRDFDSLLVLEGFNGDVPVMRPPATRATVRQLLTHTSGLGYDTWSAKLLRYHELTGVPNIAKGLKATFAVPFVCDPATQFNYGTSSDWLGLVVEAVSRQSLDRYFYDHIFGPLGMDDTVMTMSTEQRARSAPVHVRGPDGRWMPTDIDNAQNPEFYAGGHGLYSTPSDFVRLQQAVLGGGTYKATRLLEQTTVDEMFRNHIGDIEIGIFQTVLRSVAENVDLGPHKKWSLGLLINTEQEAGLRPPYSAGWAGVFNTFYWVDRANNITVSLYTQTSPFYDHTIIAIYTAFERAVYASTGLLRRNL